MGQQQLILLVLATVIVGLATVVGIRAFSENSIKSNADAMTQDAVRIANDLQAWKQKPAPFGGQTGAAKNDPANFTGFVSFEDIGYAPDGSGDLNYQNLNGCYTVAVAAGQTTITGVNQGLATQVQIELDGTTDTNVNMAADFPELGTSTATSVCTGPATPGT